MNDNSVALFPLRFSSQAIRPQQVSLLVTLVGFTEQNIVRHLQKRIDSRGAITSRIIGISLAVAGRVIRGNPRDRIV